MTTERVKFLCEQHIGRRVMRALQNLPGVEVEPVPNDIHEDDRLIIQHANGANETIVTRDSGFPNRRLCSIDKGVVFIPQEMSGVVVRLEDTLCCLTKLMRSGRLDNLGHAVCTVTPSGITVRSSSGEESVPLNQI